MTAQVFLNLLDTGDASLDAFDLMVSSLQHPNLGLPVHYLSSSTIAVCHVPICDSCIFKVTPNT